MACYNRLITRIFMGHRFFSAGVAVLPPDVIGAKFLHISLGQSLPLSIAHDPEAADGRREYWECEGAARTS